MIIRHGHQSVCADLSFYVAAKAAMVLIGDVLNRYGHY